MIDVSSLRVLLAALVGWLDHRQQQALAWRGLVTYYTLFVIDLASRRVQIVGSTP